MTFKNIIGQTPIIDRLRDAIDRGTLPHAVMFNGIEGTGGLALAVAAAQYLQTIRQTRPPRPALHLPHGQPRYLRLAQHQ
jgi:DNA polymerase III gamma/tau subunit